MCRLLQLITLLLPVCAYSAEEHTPSWPLWDGHETVEQYSRRVSLAPTLTLQLGNGVALELVLIPAGKFIMGTPEPKPVDEEAFRKKIVAGQAFFAAGAGVLLVLLCTAVIRAIRKRRRFQYSLARLMAMTLAAGVGVLGGMHWWHSGRGLELAREEYAVALARYNDGEDNEKPAHEVTISRPFYMGKYEVTQEQYMQVMGTNPSLFKGPNLPVDAVWWGQAQEFCRKASEVALSLPPPARGGGKGVVHLPTEAEWEYACRAGTETTYCSGDKEADLGRVAWYQGNSGNMAHPVGQKEPNRFGLYDMHGNVWQWCEDWCGKFAAEAATDPTGPGTGSCRVLRGGSWLLVQRNSRSAKRYMNHPAMRSNYIGFRVVVVSRTP